jgi:hypothetical protein
VGVGDARGRWCVSGDPQASGGEKGQSSAAALPAKKHTDRLPAETI